MEYHDNLNLDLPTDGERLSSAQVSGLHNLSLIPHLEELTSAAAYLFGARSAGISLLEGEEKGFTATYGVSLKKTLRDQTFCNFVTARRRTLIIPDAVTDARFRNNPLVRAEPKIRFFAGTPILLKTGHCVGALCAFDPAPRKDVTYAQERALISLSKMVVNLIEVSRENRINDIAAKVISATNDAVIAADNAGKIVYWNKAAGTIFKQSGEEMLGKDISMLFLNSDGDEVEEAFLRAMAQAKSQMSAGPLELSVVRDNGSIAPVELTLARWGSAERDGGVAAIVRSIGERKELQRENEHARAFLSRVIAQMPAMLFVKDAQTRKYLLINERGEKIIGKPANEIVGFSDMELFPDLAAGFAERDSAALMSSTPQVFESEYFRKSGDRTILRTTRSAIDGPDRPAQFILGVSEDVTRTREAEAEIQRLARYDSLTKLYNRTSLSMHLADLVNDRQKFAMLSIDLDRFKAVNDQFGHITGDEVLVQVAGRLNKIFSRSEFLARIGSDEFVAIIVGDKLRLRARRASKSLIESLGEPFVTERAVAYCGASVGVVVHPDDGDSTEQLRENADLALYRAKHEENGSACFFEEAMDIAARDRRKLEGDLRTALAENAMGLAYQPVVSIDSRQITSCEALARWTHPTRGPISPETFIPLAEECGLIETLGDELLRRACTDAQRWPSNIRVAVNLSALQFKSERLPVTVERVLAETGMEPSRLQLEVTENLLITDVEQTFRQLQQMRSLGIQVLLDDFGVGYSSLGYFQRFRFDKIKLDRSFIKNIASKESRAIIEAVVGLGRKLNMGVVAEGVETEQQMRMLVTLGCTHLQGYLFGKAMPGYLIEEFLATYAGSSRESYWVPLRGRPGVG